jgi:hypothetical protein
VKAFSSFFFFFEGKILIFFYKDLIFFFFLHMGIDFLLQRNNFFSSRYCNFSKLSSLCLLSLKVIVN